MISVSAMSTRFRSTYVVTAINGDQSDRTRFRDLKLFVDNTIDCSCVLRYDGLDGVKQRCRVKNRKVHDWTKRLVKQLNAIGIRATAPALNKSKRGYYSAYFGVPGLGEVRVSDHPLAVSSSIADVSISSPASYADLAKAYVYKHNLTFGTDYAVVGTPSMIIDRMEGAALLAATEEARLNKAAARAALDADVAARTEWWDRKVAESGLEGSPKEIKQTLKRQGMRYPAPPEEGDNHGS